VRQRARQPEGASTGTLHVDINIITHECILGVITHSSLQTDWTEDSKQADAGGE
jgi:hypothetical protein